MEKLSGIITLIHYEREELSVCPELKATGKVQKQPKNITEAEQRAAELPGNEGSIAAELNNRQK